MGGREELGNRGRGLESGVKKLSLRLDAFTMGTNGRPETVVSETAASRAVLSAHCDSDEIVSVGRNAADARVASVSIASR
jgi:hypothetical protein